MNIKTENMYTLLSIDAWREPEGGWTWNQWFKVEADIYIDYETLISPRRLFKFMRRNDWLSDESKGRVCIDDDGYNLVISDRSTMRPLFAFEPQWDI